MKPTQNEALRLDLAEQKVIIIQLMNQSTLGVQGYTTLYSDIALLVALERIREAGYLLKRL